MKGVLQPLRVRFAQHGQESPLAIVDEAGAALHDVAPLPGEADDVLAAIIGLGVAA